MMLTVLGSGTCVPSLRRGGPGLLVQSGQSSLLLDSGLGSLHKLLKLGLSYRDIDYLCYTHLHPDHTAELVPFLFACNYGEAVRRKSLTIIGGPGFEQFFQQLTAVYGHWLQARHYPLKLLELPGGKWQGPDFSLTTAPVQHSPQSIAYRIEAKGNSLVVSGDSDYCSSLVKLAQGCDLLVLECAFPEGKKVEGHLTPGLAGQIASGAGCRRLLLTHFYPICDEFPLKEQCRKAFSGELILAEDLLQLAV
jgi:ribonuclease BN (tRNA processing enzyme)